MSVIIIRLPIICLVILCFNVLCGVATTEHLLPYVNSGATSTINTDTMTQMTATQNITTNNNNGYIGFFTTSIQIIGGVVSIFKVVIGGFAIMLMQMHVPSEIALGAQLMLVALSIFELLMLWRGIPL